MIGLVAEGDSLDPFWIGKIARDHIDEIEELIQRNLVQPPFSAQNFCNEKTSKAGSRAFAHNLRLPIFSMWSE